MDPNKAASILERVDRSSGPGSCWPWTGPPDAYGYGQVKIKQADGKWRPRRVHRIVYELLVGEIPDGLTIGHDCHDDDLGCPGGKGDSHRLCCNPDHLSPQKRGENAMRGNSPAAVNARKTSCSTCGRPLSGDNLVLEPRKGRTPGRKCKDCRNRRQREFRKRNPGYDKRRYGARQAIRAAG